MGCVPYTCGLRHTGPSACILPVPSDLSLKVRSSGMPSVPPSKYPNVGTVRLGHVCVPSPAQCHHRGTHGMCLLS